MNDEITEAARKELEWIETSYDNLIAGYLHYKNLYREYKEIVEILFNKQVDLQEFINSVTNTEYNLYKNYKLTKKEFNKLRRISNAKLL